MSYINGMVLLKGGETWGDDEIYGQVERVMNMFEISVFIFMVFVVTGRNYSTIFSREK